MKTLWIPAVSLVCTASHTAAQAGSNIDDLAKELANPGAANATLNFKIEYRTFYGDLSGASDQDSTTFTFQPGFNTTTGRFDTLESWGDVPVDLLCSWSADSWTSGAGVAGNVPTDSQASSENWLLGPSFLGVKTFDWGVAGIFPFQNEKTGERAEHLDHVFAVLPVLWPGGWLADWYWSNHDI